MLPSATTNSVNFVSVYGTCFWRTEHHQAFKYLTLKLKIKYKSRVFKCQLMVSTAETSSLHIDVVSRICCGRWQHVCQFLM